MTKLWSLQEILIEVLKFVFNLNMDWWYCEIVNVGVYYFCVVLRETLKIIFVWISLPFDLCSNLLDLGSIWVAVILGGCEWWRMWFLCRVERETEEHLRGGERRRRRSRATSLLSKQIIFLYFHICLLNLLNSCLNIFKHETNRFKYIYVYLRNAILDNIYKDQVYRVES